MKKDVILEALKNVGIELSEEKQKEFITAINVANDNDIQKFKKEIESLQTKIVESENNLKLKDNELSKFDLKEIEALRQYKEDNEKKMLEEKHNSKLTEFLDKNNYSHDEILLSYINSKLAPIFGDDDEITNGEQLLAGLDMQAKQYKITETDNGAKAIPSNGVTSKNADVQNMSYDEYKNWRKENN